MKQCKHLTTSDKLYDGFRLDVLNAFNDELLVRTTRALEDFLRVNIHTMLIDKIHGQNPYKQDVKDINKLLSVGYVEIFDQRFDIK